MEDVEAHLPLFFAAPIQWYTQLLGSDSLILQDEIIFSELSAYNRIQICGKTGIQNISIPLVGESRKGRSSKVEISYTQRWQNHLINALRTAYGKSPFYEYYDYRLEPILKQEYQYLWDLNFDILKFTLSCLKLDNQITKTEMVEKVSLIEESTEIIPYYQVFSDTTGFIPGLSILDLIFNEGIQATEILMKMKNIHLKIK